LGSWIIFAVHTCVVAGFMVNMASWIFPKKASKIRAPQTMKNLHILNFRDVWASSSVKIIKPTTSNTTDMYSFAGYFLLKPGMKAPIIITGKTCNGSNHIIMCNPTLTLSTIIYIYRRLIYLGRLEHDLGRIVEKHQRSLGQPLGSHQYYIDIYVCFPWIHDLLQSKAVEIYKPNIVYTQSLVQKWNTTHSLAQKNKTNELWISKHGLFCKFFSITNEIKKMKVIRCVETLIDLRTHMAVTRSRKSTSQTPLTK